MKKDILLKASAMPVTSPSYPLGPYRFFDREYFIISYETDMEALRAIVPEPLEIVEPIVKYEFIAMPDSNGLGSYKESGQVIPVTYQGQAGSYVHSMYLNDVAAILAGREIWGFPKKWGNPKLAVEEDTLIGSLDYGSIRVATGTMGYKFHEADRAACLSALQEPTYLLKMIPNVDGQPYLCQLVRYQLTDITIKSAWTGPAALELHQHALAPVAQLPVKRVLSAIHVVADLTLPFGEIIFDYLGN